MNGAPKPIQAARKAEEYSLSCVCGLDYTALAAAIDRAGTVTCPNPKCGRTSRVEWREARAA